MNKRYPLSWLVLIVALFTASVVAQEQETAGRDWLHHQGDAGATRYSTLAQINVSNVTGLERAWTFHTQSGRFAGAPMVIDSVMYFSAPNGVFALDAVTGEQIWKYEPPALPAADARSRFLSGGGAAGTALRGPMYWPGSDQIRPRIYSTTSKGLAAIDAASGRLVPGFGDDGVIPGLRPTSPAAFYENVLITQGGVEQGHGETVKGWDIVSGKLIWTFYLKAQPGDINRISWLDGSADKDFTPSIWGLFTVDAVRGTVFVPVEKVGNDYWGGEHHGNNLYSDSLVALDALTGKMKWFQQLVHHDIWDYDIAAAPTLIDVVREGKTIPAVVQMNKMGLMFIFDRDTGEPVFGMEERPVPQTTVPGEWTSPTQPFPIKPEPLVRNTMTRANLAKVTPEHEAFCARLWDDYKLSDAVPYQPWKLDQDIIVFPGAQGGSNWWGAAFNPSLALIIANVHTAGQWGHLELTESGMRKVTPEQRRFWNNDKMWSCSEPPWGELVAVDANTGDIAWRVPLGEFEELSAQGVPPTGTPSVGGLITTAGDLVFIGATVDGYFRAFDARNGKELWRDRLPAPSQGTPSTYMGRDGKQYVVIGGNGGGYFMRDQTSDEVIAYRLSGK
ncbi:MAG: PQQ-binding-like beta-propeller repeat protein [Gammaproteobacteria bacterium]|nr:PQQ-binding-like beta-propeller repeat protein [Gammaproteobacteria bacterium]MDH5302887.1 PQQ-binding-like beta-propeller repeat protein [Gammaproteobacteria bacterium]MDH5320992.1 PQQ-binding-like beta-propeller repeat protein [Gammaproteobacteria bacterium]